MAESRTITEWMRNQKYDQWVPHCQRESPPGYREAPADWQIGLDIVLPTSPDLYCWACSGLMSTCHMVLAHFGTATGYVECTPLSPFEQRLALKVNCLQEHAAAVDGRFVELRDDMRTVFEVDNALVVLIRLADHERFLNWRPDDERAAARAAQLFVQDTRRTRRWQWMQAAHWHPPSPGFNPRAWDNLPAPSGAADDDDAWHWHPETL